MSSEHGLYVELLPDGKIKRDIVGSSGEASLEDTVVSGEVILFSELNFEPYAVVVDLIRSQALSLIHICSTTESTPRRSWNMSLESGQRLSVEELKQLNRPKTMPPQPAPIPPEHPTQQEWNELRAALKLSLIHI